MYLPVSVNGLYHTFCDFALPCIRASEGLTRHGVIPTDEIWLKISGDKGRESFKLNIQLCNIPSGGFRNLKRGVPDISFACPPYFYTVPNKQNYFSHPSILKMHAAGWLAY